MAKAKPKRPPKPKPPPRAEPPAAEPKAAPPLRLEYRSPAELAENPANWRRHPEAQTAALAGVLAEVGWAGACLLNERTGRLIDGHLRRKLALDRGDARVPVLVGDWTEEQERTILATLDPIGAMAVADAAALDALLKGVSAGSEAVAALLDDLAHANPPDPPVPGGGGDDFDAAAGEKGPTRTKAGELWVIGGVHRLLVGDCTVAENVARLMGGAKAGLCFTSPPYAQQREYGEAAKEKVQDWHALMCGAFAPLADHLEADGQVLVNLGLVHREGEWVPYWSEWIEWMRSQGWRRFGWYVWDQGHGLPGDWNGRLAPAFEFVFHFNRQPKHPEKWVEKKAENVRVPHRRTMRNADGTTSAFTSPGSSLQPNKIPDSVIRVMRQKGPLGDDIDHPAPYPVALPEFALNSWPADVYDPFLGSGTTLVAAHRLGRICYGCELEPKYCDVILKRAEAEGLACEREEAARGEARAR